MGTHTLRHSFARHLLVHGILINYLSRWLGHSSIQTTLIYLEVVGLPTVVQPAYSPELNPAERVFEEVRRWVEGRVYESIEERVEAVNAYLRRLESDSPTGTIACRMGLDRGVGPEPTVQLCGILRLKRY